MPSGKGAFELLLELEQSSNQSREIAEQQLLSAGHFQYVRFRVSECFLMVKVISISEILPLPAVTQVPFTKPWVVGVSNIRGEVIPISDFSHFLFERGINKNKKNKLIILKGAGFSTAILVDEVLGMSDVVEDDISTDTSSVEEQIKPYIIGTVTRDEHTYSVMDSKTLLAEPGFMKAAV
ncbi:MAG: chemotaxis protein CheW [Gammaproteobacteria bacterium]|nr:chemotaxis protein CheW [Gammaproteobacteria bacterium]